MLVRIQPLPTLHRGSELRMLDYLQEKLTLETTEPSFSSLPFRFTEIAKVILDVYVLPLSVSLF